MQSSYKMSLETESAVYACICVDILLHTLYMIHTKLNIFIYNRKINHSEFGVNFQVKTFQIKVV